MNSLKAVPAAFVTPSADVSTPPTWGNMIIEQRTESEFVIFTATRDLTDATGGAASDALEPMREAVAMRCTNWAPGEDADPMFKRWRYVPDERGRRSMVDRRLR
jgi:hypothetical protein